VRPRWVASLRGGWAVGFRAAQIHVDPASWKIRQHAAVNFLAAGPFLDELTLHARWNGTGVVIERVRARGKWLRLQGMGAWQGEGARKVWVRGQAAAVLLNALGVQGVRGTWEPFWCRLEGTGRRSAFSVRTRAYQWNMAGGYGA